ncbi:hypothetical protein HEB94_006690 [Actinopolymorpha pittospori]|uniref:Uncharacterized protein n=1 Tax=Actinopolymorpha pittospori TaxID=648752 RepID=A0A927RB76_9ACTN|nr:hypothetical protein [Actinopolymorpha pittospori]
MLPYQNPHTCLSSVRLMTRGGKLLWPGVLGGDGLEGRGASTGTPVTLCQNSAHSNAANLPTPHTRRRWVRRGAKLS